MALAPCFSLPPSHRYSWGARRCFDNKGPQKEPSSHGSAVVSSLLGDWRRRWAALDEEDSEGSRHDCLAFLSLKVDNENVVKRNFWLGLRENLVEASPQSLEKLEATLWLFSWSSFGPTLGPYGDIDADRSLCIASSPKGSEQRSIGVGLGVGSEGIS